MSRNENRHNRYDDNYEYQTNKRAQAVPQGYGAKGSFEDVSSYSSQGQKGPRKKKSAGRKAIEIILAVIFSLLIVLGAGLIYVSTYLLGDLNTTSLTKDPAELGIASDVISDNSIKNIALFGVDSRGNSFTGNSDAIIIMSVDMKHNKIKLTSVLRDSYVPIEGNGSYKINAAYSWGGYELAIKTLNQNYNMDIMDYVTVNFGRLAELIDAVGGVDVEIREDEISYMNDNLRGLAIEQPELGIDSDDEVTEAGLLHLSGHQAVAYSRIRYLDSDFGRVGRQQNVLEAMFQRVMTMSKAEYPSMIKQMMPLCETSLDPGDVLPLAQVALSGFTMERMTIPNEITGYDDPYIDDMSVILYDLEDASHLIDAFIYEQDSPYYDTYYGSSTEVDE
ncbi:LCP family protein [Scatolibacter rhodanostii]|uniref:LCP family protein n=1 Tax=Scatolibacter rhodanostii TaxID=2014781 RepID=UPI000C08667F|nr:LCP family protein [Scatolibacter rhodanostii]